MDLRCLLRIKAYGPIFSMVGGKKTFVMSESSNEKGAMEVTVYLLLPILMDRTIETARILFFSSGSKGSHSGALAP